MCIRDREKLAELNVDLFEHEVDLKRHVYALGKLAGRTVQQSRALGKNLWASSRHATPWQNASGGGVGKARTPPPLPKGQGNIYLTPGSGYQQGDAGLTPGLAASHRGAGAVSTPGPAPSHQEMVNVVESVAGGFQRAIDSIAEKFAELHTKESGDAYAGTSDKFQAISGLEFKRAPPTIRDEDPDLDRHDLAFDNMIMCYAFGSRKPRDR